MKTQGIRTVYIWLIIYFLGLGHSHALSFETNALIPNVQILFNGMTRRITVEPQNNFPSDFNQILVVALGYGPFEINLSKLTPPGDLVGMTGFAISSAGTIPFFKYGEVNTTLKASMQIGNENAPFGLLWIVTWTYSSSEDPPQGYSLSFAF